MRSRTLSLFALSSLFLACGGAVDGSDAAGGRQQASPSTALSPFQSARTGPWGVWQLSGLDVTPGELEPWAPQPMELEIRPDGTAYRWSCWRTASLDALPRCEAEYRFDCRTGTVAWDEATSSWRTDLVDGRVYPVPEQGRISVEPGGAIRIEAIDAKHTAGHFRPLGDVTTDAVCAG